MNIRDNQYIREFCGNFNTPVAVFDESLLCLYCNKHDFIKPGEMLGCYLLTRITNPLENNKRGMVTVNGIKYCVRIVPLMDGLYFGEFFDVDELNSLAEFTDLYDKIVPYSEIVCVNIANVWRHLNDLEQFCYDNQQLKEKVDGLLSAKKSFNALDSDIQNVIGFVDLLLKKQQQEKTPISVHMLVESLIAHCNTVLSNTGRSIEFLSDAQDCYILSHRRYALVALINALQNALLYSPADSVPSAILTSVIENNRRYVYFKLVNDDIYFVDEKNAFGVERNFYSQRAGLGIPIVREFAKSCDGSFSIKDIGGKVVLELKIPQFEHGDDRSLKFESPSESYYTSDLPNIVDVKMRKVVDLFRKKE